MGTNAVHKYTEKPRKIMIFTIFGVLFLWMFLSWFGLRLPYLYTEQINSIRIYFIFPLILSLFVALLFLKRTSKGETLFKSWVVQTKVKKGNLNEVYWGGIGLVLIAATISWTSAAIPAWCSFFFGKEIFSMRVEVVNIAARGGGAWTKYYEFQLIDIDKNRYWLKLDAPTVKELGVSKKEMMCISGAESPFGRYISEVYRSVSC